MMSCATTPCPVCHSNNNNNNNNNNNDNNNNNNDNNNFQRCSIALYKNV